MGHHRALRGRIFRTTSPGDAGASCGAKDVTVRTLSLHKGLANVRCTTDPCHDYRKNDLCLTCDGFMSGPLLSFRSFPRVSCDGNAILRHCEENCRDYKHNARDRRYCGGKMIEGFDTVDLGWEELGRGLFW